MKKVCFICLCFLCVMLLVTSCSDDSSSTKPNAPDSTDGGDGNGDGNGNGDYIESFFVEVPEGSFSMGSYLGEGDEQLVHTVTLSSFKMADQEVTNAEYAQIITSHTYTEGQENYPVTSISYEDMMIYCNLLSIRDGKEPCYYNNENKVFADWTDFNSHALLWDVTADGYRLPTESEWEYVAEAGQATNHFSGSSNIDSVAWYQNNAGYRLHDVKGKAPNAWGMYDMTGNASEQCWNYEDYSYSATNNPISGYATETLAIRGGNFSNWEDESQIFRRWQNYDVEGERTGFRLVVDSNIPASGEQLPFPQIIQENVTDLTSPREVKIMCEFANYEVRYTTNGVEPTENSPLYSQPFTVSTTTTVKAKVYKTGYMPSAVATTEISFNCPAPTIYPYSGIFNASKTISINPVDFEYPIYYTLDGSTPDENSTLYTDSFTIEETTVIKAIGILNGTTYSPVAESEITIINFGDPEYGVFTLAAYPNSDNSVTVNWHTWNESVYSNFRVRKGTTPNYYESMPSNLIPAQDYTGTASHNWNDENINQAGIYYYWLVSYLNGDWTEIVMGPVKAKVE